MTPDVLKLKFLIFGTSGVLYLYFLSSFVFAASYPNSCPSEARAIVDAVGGCAEVDKNAYAAVYEQCCALPAPAPNKSVVLWISLVVVVVGLGIGIWHFRQKSK